MIYFLVARELAFHWLPACKSSCYLLPALCLLTLPALLLLLCLYQPPVSLLFQFAVCRAYALAWPDRHKGKRWISVSPAISTEKLFHLYDCLPLSSFASSSQINLPVRIDFEFSSRSELLCGPHSISTLHSNTFDWQIENVTEALLDCLDCVDDRRQH